MITIDRIKAYGIEKVMEAEGYLTVKETAIRCNMSESAVRQAIHTSIESNDKHKVFETGGFRIPRRIYNIWLHDILNNIEGYSDVCDSYYQEFMKAKEIKNVYFTA